MVKKAKKGGFWGGVVGGVSKGLIKGPIFPWMGYPQQIGKSGGEGGVKKGGFLGFFDVFWRFLRFGNFAEKVSKMAKMSKKVKGAKKGVLDDLRFFGLFNGF